METQTFVRKPFTVEAIQITNDNIKELAPLIGTLRSHRGKFYIEVNRKKVPVLSEVEVDYWMTKVENGKIRCYSDKVFQQQFTAMTPEIKSWVEFLNMEDVDEEIEVESDPEEEAALSSG